MKTTTLRPSQGGKMHKPVGEGLPEPWELKRGDLVRILCTRGAMVKDAGTTGTVSSFIPASKEDPVAFCFVTPVNQQQSFCHPREQLRLIPPPPKNPDLEALVKALEAGSYNPDPILSQGFPLKIEPLKYIWPSSTGTSTGNDKLSWLEWATHSPKLLQVYDVKSQNRNGVGDFVRVTTTEDLKLIGTIDGIKILESERVLVKNTNIPDGVYSMSATVKEAPKEPEKDYRGFNWDEYLK